MTRQLDHRARQLAAGWERITLMLDPETLESLARIRAVSGLSAVGAVKWAVNQAAMGCAEEQS